MPSEPSPPARPVNAKRIRLFIKTYCPWCRQAMEWLDRHGIAYEVYDVLADPNAYEEMVRLSGQTLAPVIDVDGKVLADFAAPELAVWWQQRACA